MTLSDHLHCPACHARIAAGPDQGLRCTSCERVFPLLNGIVDFATSSHTPPAPDAEFWVPTDTADSVARMRAAAGDRWPAFLGATIAFGTGHPETIDAILTGGATRGLLVLDTAMDRLLADRPPFGALGLDQPVACARVDDIQQTTRDAVADTLICTDLLARAADVRGFLATIQRVLKPNGRAALIVLNRRYVEAMCLAMAEALVQRHVRDGAWPDGPVVDMLAQMRRRLLHRDDPDVLAGLDRKHLFDSEALEDLGRETGFATAEMIPLDPDPTGMDTLCRFLHAAGAPPDFTAAFGGLAASVGQPFFNLLGRQDQSAAMLLWLTKAPGPRVRIFADPPAPPHPAFVGSDAALGGLAPRWSIELRASDTPDGIVVGIGGWCLCNTDVRWIRLTLDGIAQHTPVWLARPDVHGVLNTSGLYHPLNTLCSGLAGQLRFDGVHPTDNTCPFRLEVVLASGPVVTGPAPDRLVMGEPMVVTH